MKHLLLAVLSGALLVGCAPAPDGAPASPTEGPAVGPRPVGPVDEAIVTRVVDGDTIVVRIGEQQMRLRYIGIDAPELGDPAPEPWADEATEANRMLVANQTVFLERDVSDTDRFARLLRYVWLRAHFADGTERWTMVNLELVRLGFARAVSYPPDVQHQHLLRDAEREARHAGAGLWSED
ncbi:MAG TPA: thermonuclease family protein [Candidatus Limnocylindrales bacterium]|nr:thermonuclease family protein [Candidatus Limnocylindrales bacterium]